MAQSTKDIATADALGLAVAGSEGVLPGNISHTEFLRQGFSLDRTVKVGNPENGGIPGYCGLLIGPGPDIELNESASRNAEDEKPMMPSWTFHPIDSKTLKPVESIVDTLICPHQLDAICKRAHQLALTKGKPILIFVKWEGLGKNRLGQPFNRYMSATKIWDVETPKTA